MRIFLALALACIPVSLAATTIVVFRTATGIVLATDSAAVQLTSEGRHHTTVGCKIGHAGKWWFLNGGYYAPDSIADRLTKTRTLEEALTSLRTLRSDVIAHKALYPGRQPGFPLMTVVIAAPDLTLGVFMVSLKTADPFAVITETGTCPGALCPTGGYYLIGQPGDAPPNPMVKNLPPWFFRADAVAARRFIEGQILFSPEFAKAPIDVLELTAAGPVGGPGAGCSGRPAGPQGQDSARPSPPDSRPGRAVPGGTP